MLALLGWNPGTEQELFTLSELVEAFSLERVGKSGAKFDPDKTRWFNQQYLRKKSNEELAGLFIPVLEKAGIQPGKFGEEYIAKVCGLMKERATFVQDMLEGIYLFKAPENYDEKTVRKKWKEKTPEIIRGLREKLAAIDDFSAENIEQTFKAYLTEHQLGFGAVLPNLRVLITGVGMGPSLFDICALIGKDETLRRIDTGLEKLSA